MLSTAERSAMIDKLEALPALAVKAVEGMSEAELDTPYRDGGWTRRQVIHHIADSHLNAFVRIRLILTEEHPTLKPYDQDSWAELSDSMTGPVNASLQIIAGLHRRLVLLLRSLTDEQWTRTAFHPENGEMNVDDFLKLYSWHGEHHLAQIRA